MLKTAYVYILASRKNGTLYTGVTSNLERRMYEHKHHLLDGFTDKYDVTRLVWFTQGEDIREAISLEKKIKNRNRTWKIELIEKTNPNWDDLAVNWVNFGSCDYAQDDGSNAQDDGSNAQSDTPRSHPASVIPRAVVESTFGAVANTNISEGK